MAEFILQDRPTFKVAHWYRCHGLVDRDNFLAFEKTFGEIINTLSTIPDNDKLWNYVRSLFAYEDYADCVPINAANLSILFHPVQVFLNCIGMDWNKDISIQKRIKPFVHTIQFARALIAKQLNVEPKLVAFLRNGSDPNAVISNGLDFAPGEQVLVWNENHPTGGEVAWKIRRERFQNIDIKVLDLEGETDPTKIVEKFLRKVNEKTKLVAFSEISHLSGTRLPAKLLCQAIHSQYSNIHVHVDGAQSWGALNHDLKDMGCDSYSGGSHKWFLGPKETGILYMKEDRIPNFAPKDIGYNGEMQPPPDPLPLDASRFEMVGQRNDTNLIGLLYTADLMGLIGYDKIEDRIKALSTRLRKNLEELLDDLPEEQKFVIETPSEEDMFHGIMVIKWPEDSSVNPPLSEQVYNRLYENHKIGVSTKKGNRMRFSPHIYNTEKHMDRVVSAMSVELERLRAK